MAAFPSAGKFQASAIRVEQNRFVSFFSDGSNRIRTTPGQRFGFTLTSIPMVKADFWEIQAFLFANNDTTFTVAHPLYASPVGTPSGTPLVNGGSQTGSSLITDGWTPGASNVLKAGDVFNIAGEEKVYMAASDVSADGGGNATITLTSDLVSSPTNNNALTTSNVVFTVVQRGRVQEFTTDIHKHYRYQLDVIEAF